ncbi:MAG: response regulator transcription factor [Acidobacteriota bacterium]|nr:response regulator transcription factor [Acidobacteriota bacterium]
MTQIVVVEDDPRIASFLAKGLAAEGYIVSIASDEREATSLVDFIGGDLSLVLLDLGLPGSDGMSFLSVLRDRGIRAPVIIVTARQATTDKVAGLDAGATDYITKPFAFDEMLARIRAALRTPDQEVSNLLVVEDLHFDLSSKEIRRGDLQIELSPREWALLELFMRNPTQILSRVQILNRVWDYGFDPSSNIVDVYVGYLRRKLNRPGLTPLIHTVRGAGYRLLPRP